MACTACAMSDGTYVGSYPKVTVMDGKKADGCYKEFLSNGKISTVKDILDWAESDC